MRPEDPTNPIPDGVPRLAVVFDHDYKILHDPVLLFQEITLNSIMPWLVEIITDAGEYSEPDARNFTVFILDEDVEGKLRPLFDATIHDCRVPMQRHDPSLN